MQSSKNDIWVWLKSLSDLTLIMYFHMVSTVFYQWTEAPYWQTHAFANMHGFGVSRAFSLASWWFWLHRTQLLSLVLIVKARQSVLLTYRRVSLPANTLRWCGKCSLPALCGAFLYAQPKNVKKLGCSRHLRGHDSTAVSHGIIIFGDLIFKLYNYQ